MHGIESRPQEAIQFILNGQETVMRMFTPSGVVDYVLRPSQLPTMIEQLAHMLPRIQSWQQR